MRPPATPRIKLRSKSFLVDLGWLSHDTRVSVFIARAIDEIALLIVTAAR